MAAFHNQQQQQNAEMDIDNDSEDGGEGGYSTPPELSSTKAVAALTQRSAQAVFGPLGGLRPQSPTLTTKELLRSKAMDQTAKSISASLVEKQYVLTTSFTNLEPTGGYVICKKILCMYGSSLQ